MWSRHYSWPMLISHMSLWLYLHPSITPPRRGSLSLSFVSALHCFIALNGVHMKLKMINIHQGLMVLWYHVLVLFTSIYMSIGTNVEWVAFVFCNYLFTFAILDPFVWNHIQVELCFKHMYSNLPFKYASQLVAQLFWQKPWFILYCLNMLCIVVCCACMDFSRLTFNVNLLTYC